MAIAKRRYNLSVFSHKRVKSLIKLSDPDTPVSFRVLYDCPSVQVAELFL